MDDKWAREIAQRLHRRVKDETQANAVLLEKRRLLEEQGPVLWKQVIEFVKNLCDELNAEYGQELLAISSSTVRELNVHFQFSGNASELRAAFDISTSSEALRWSYAGIASRMNHGESCYLYVDAGIVSLRSGARISTPESIATQMLNGLVGV